MRLLSTLILLLFSAGLVVLAFGALSNLWEGHPDNSAGTYIAIGGVSLALALGFAVAAASVLRRP